MPDRKMFWRIVRRLFAAQRGRLFAILLALGAGAAVTAALLNIRVDAASRLTKEFRTFGANVIVAPRNSMLGVDAYAGHAGRICYNAVQQFSRIA